MCDYTPFSIISGFSTLTKVPNQEPERLVMHIFLLRFILFSVDKRYIFTIDDLDTVAPAYEYFMAKLTDLDPEQCWNISIEELSTEKIHQTFC